MSHPVPVWGTLVAQLPACQQMISISLGSSPGQSHIDHETVCDLHLLDIGLPYRDGLSSHAIRDSGACNEHFGPWMQVMQYRQQILRAVSYGWWILLQVQDGGYPERCVQEKRIHASCYIAVYAECDNGNEIFGWKSHTEAVKSGLYRWEKGYSK